MVEISDELRARLISDGKREARLQADRVNRLADAAGGGGPHRPLPGSVSPSKLETSLRHYAQRKTRNGAQWLKLVVDNEQ